MNKLTPILPCGSLSAVSEPRSSVQADELLAAWTALWHPAIVAAARTMPKCTAAAQPPDDPTGHLLLIPPTAEPLVPEEWWEHAQQLGAKWIRGKSSRREMIAAALAMLESPPALDPDLVADFLALGYCHYVVETTTSQSSYMNSLDDRAIEKELVAAAAAACGGDGSEAHERLQAAFDLLHTARENYFAAESHLLDLTLVAGTTLGQSLRRELAGRAGQGAQGVPDPVFADRKIGTVPCNLLLSAEVLEQMAACEPATLETLRQSLQLGVASIVGGEYRELELPLLPIEAVRSQIVKGLSVYQQHLAARPTIFGRRRFGMTPLLPQILDSLGFSGALHATLDDGRFPATGASRQRWEGLDGTMIETLARVPLDAAAADGFVRLPQSISGATDVDYNPTVIFAHWPGRTSIWHEDIRRIQRYTSALGTFRSLPEYFEQTGVSAHHSAHRADDYRSPYLAQAVAAGEKDPISKWQRYYAVYAAAEAAETLAKVSGTLRVPTANGTRSVPDTLTTCSAEFAQAVGGACSAARQQDPNDSRPNPPHQAPAGIMAINPLSFSRCVRVDVSALAAWPDVAGAVRRVGTAAGKTWAIVEVPPLGFAIVRPGTRQVTRPSRDIFSFFRRPAPKSSLAMRDAKQGAVLHNEFFEVVIDPHLGAIRGIYELRSRGPRLAQQVAMRLHGGDEDDAYSIMAADEIRVAEAGPVIGEVVVHGRLMDRTGQIAAEFRQTTRVTWGSRVIEIEIEIDPRREPDGDPWNSYFAARFAWAQDAPTIYRGVNQATVASELPRLESPQFVEIRETVPILAEQAGRLHKGRGPAKMGLSPLPPTNRTTILAAGLPYHRRCGRRKLDSLLIVRGETGRRFRLGIGIDLPQPQAAALDFVTPSPDVPLASLPKSDSAWLYHLDNRAVVATHWEAIVENGSVAGVRVRLLETEGRHVSLALRSFRAVNSAQKLGGANRAAEDLTVAGDQVSVPLRPYEWADVEMR